MRTTLLGTLVLALAAATPAGAQTTAPAATTRPSVTQGASPPATRPAQAATRPASTVPFSLEGRQVEIQRAPSTPDERFAYAAYETNLGQITLAEQAQKQGASAEVKAYARQVAAESAKLNEALGKVMAEGRMPVPKSPGRNFVVTAGILQNSQGGTFDAQYLAYTLAQQKSAAEVPEDLQSEAVKAYAAAQTEALKALTQTGAEVQKTAVAGATPMEESQTRPTAEE